MRVFVAGASGAIGRRLVPRLVEAGHEVTGTTRSPEKVDAVRDAGAEPVLLDALDADAVHAAVTAASPEVVVHELTALPRAVNPRTMKRDFALNDRLRSEGTRHLVQAAGAAGARRVVAQSIAFAYRPDGDGLKTEGDPLYLDAPEPFRRSVGALHDLETAVLGAGGPEGVVLRYGYFYGPGTSFAADGSNADQVRRRRMPVVGRGAGVWSFIHVDDAAAATVAAVEGGAAGAYNVVDDDPAPVREWLPAFAAAVGAPMPWRVPTFAARLVAGRYGALVMTRLRGASNAKARFELRWTPAHPTWREGFRTALR